MPDNLLATLLTFQVQSKRGMPRCSVRLWKHRRPLERSCRRCQQHWQGGSDRRSHVPGADTPGRVQTHNATSPAQPTASTSAPTAHKMPGKGFPYSLPSVGPGADPGVQTVSPQVTISRPPGGRLPLHSASGSGTILVKWEEMEKQANRWSE